MRTYVTINSIDITRFNIQNFIWNEIKEGKIILQERLTGVSLFLGDITVSISEKIQVCFVDLQDSQDCIKIIKKNRHIDFFSALYTLCFLKNFYEGLFRKNSEQNMVLFHEGGHTHAIGFTFNQESNIWILTRTKMEDAHLKKVRMFICL